MVLLNNYVCATDVIILKFETTFAVAVALSPTANLETTLPTVVVVVLLVAVVVTSACIILHFK